MSVHAAKRRTRTGPRRYHLALATFTHVSVVLSEIGSAERSQTSWSRHTSMLPAGSPDPGQEAVFDLFGVVGVAGEFGLEGAVFAVRADDQDQDRECRGDQAVE